MKCNLFCTFFVDLLSFIIFSSLTNAATANKYSPHVDWVSTAYHMLSSDTKRKQLGSMQVGQRQAFVRDSSWSNFVFFDGIGISLNVAEASSL